MPAKILFHRGVEKDLKKIPKNIRQKFFKAAEKLSQEPLSGIPLKGEFKGSRKIRLGDYRIVYAFNSKTQTLTIYRIEPRQGVYKN